MLPALALLTSSLLTQAPAPTTSSVDVKLPFVSTLHVENDIIARSDRFYSNGLRIEHYGEYDACRQLALALRLPEGVQHRYLCGGSLAQNMYTPSHITPFGGDEPFPDPNDRPYAGWLHGGLVFQHIYAAETPAASSRFTLNATVGVVGSAAGAGETQRAWHSTLNHIFGEAYLFARGQARFVARNLFLDGTLFRPSLSVRKTPFVGDSEFGAAFRTRRFQLDVSRVFRSQEMAEPPNPHLSGHRFTQLQLSYLQP